MSRNSSVALGDHFVRFIDTQVRAGLRLLEEHETRVKSLQDALIAGEESGRPQPLDRESLLHKMKTRHAL
ncbi:type II toxin-antitoxin system ParD family antitoxin [Pseudochrobactrum sp. MP213Fo]|uniref:type II toxin-antitoxin system ParD family antitoxin n=1 Tax=Pseudochrobactrum sp. MP213Fo TaxID=3022250 RepID=UPI003B9F4C1C